MKNFSKICISLLCFLTYGFSTIFAADDCSIFAVQEYGNGGFNIVSAKRETGAYNRSNFLTIEEQKNIITKNDINVAIINLKKYCCEKGLGGLTSSSSTCINDKKYFNDNSLDSPYLFDHLFDIVMRRLTGLSGDNNIYATMTLDNSGSERRNFINSKAIDLSGTSPETITDKYKKFRTSNPTYDINTEVIDKFPGDNSAFLNFISGKISGNQKIAENFKNYSKRSLYDKYHNACATSAYLYALLLQGNENNASDRSTVIKNLNNCNILVENQIANEVSYTNYVIQAAGNRLLSLSQNNYFSYLYNRIDTLKETIKDISSKFLYIYRAVPQLVKYCTK